MTATAAIICGSVGGIFAIVIISVLALAYYRRLSPINHVEPSSVAETGDYPPLGYELVLLEETLQLKNNGDCTLRLEGSELATGTLLYANDVWQCSFDARKPSTFHLFSIVKSEGVEAFEEKLLELRVTATEMSIKPVFRSMRLNHLIWKMKPAVYMQRAKVLEKLIFSGKLLKTIMVGRAPCRYYKLMCNTGDTQVIANPSDDLICSSNAAISSYAVPSVSIATNLFNMRIEPAKVSATNLSNHTVTVNVKPEDSDNYLSTTLQQMFHALPRRGIYQFSVLPHQSDEFKNLLQLTIGDQIFIEPLEKFKSLDINCSVHTLPEVSGAPLLPVMVSQVLTKMELPRKNHSYLLHFTLQSRPAGTEDAGADDEYSSRTLD